MWESSELTASVLRSGFPEPVLIAYGAKLNYLINAPHHQWWRFVTPMFIHIDVLHLLMNMVSLLILGPFVEKLYGSAKFVFFWVLAGIAGTLASYLTLRPSLATGLFGSFLFKGVDVPSAGASGALFGLIGVLFVFGIKYRHELPEGFKRVFGTGMLPIIFINLFIGLIGRLHVGNAAHIGGLLVGAALALAVGYRRPGASASVNNIWRVGQVLLLLLIVLGFYKVARNFHRPVAAVTRASLNGNALEYVNYVSAMNQVQEKVSAVIHNNDLSDVAAVTQKAMQAPVPDSKAGELRSRLLIILSKLAGAAIAPSPSPGSGPAPPRQLDQKVVDEFKQWRKEYDDWLKVAVKVHTRQ